MSLAGLLLALAVAAVVYVGFAVRGLWRGSETGWRGTLGLAIALCLLAGRANAQTAPAPASPASVPAAPTATAGAPTQTPTALPPIQWGPLSWYHGIALPVVEFFPNQLHPIQAIDRGGYAVELCEGDFKVSATKTLSVVCLGVSLFARIDTTVYNPIGDIQIVPSISFAGGLFAVGPIFTAYSATGDGFLQTGRDPGPGIAFSTSFPLGWLVGTSG